MSNSLRLCELKSGQERWSGLLFLSPGDLPDPGIEPTPPALAGDSLPLSHPKDNCGRGRELASVLFPGPRKLSSSNLSV